MEHNRHRAPGRTSRRSLALAGVAGLLVGALAVGAGWWVSEGSGLPPASTATAATPTPAASTHASRKPAETRNEVAIPSAAAAPPSAGNEPVLLLGDSLAVGISPYVDAGLGER